MHNVRNVKCEKERNVYQKSWVPWRLLPQLKWSIMDSSSVHTVCLARIPLIVLSHCYLSFEPVHSNFQELWNLSCHHKSALLVHYLGLPSWFLEYTKCLEQSSLTGIHEFSYSRSVPTILTPLSQFPIFFSFCFPFPIKTHARCNNNSVAIDISGISITTD